MKDDQQFKIRYLIGDATKPQTGENETAGIIHICNDLNRWGRGFVLPLGKAYPQAKTAYHRLFDSGQNVPLGTLQEIEAADNILIYNMIAQHGLISTTNPHPLSYPALSKCLEQVVSRINARRQQTDHIFSVHCPRIGAGLGGGEWSIIEEILHSSLVEAGINVFVYDLPK